MQRRRTEEGEEREERESEREKEREREKEMGLHSVTTMRTSLSANLRRVSTLALVLHAEMVHSHTHCRAASAKQRS